MKAFSLGLIISFFLLFSCATDDSNDPIEPANLIGVWNLVDVNTQNGQAMVTESGVTIAADFSIGTSNEDVQVTITENPNIISSEGSFTQTTTITILGQEETEESVIDGAFLDGSWELNDTTLVITSGDNMLDDFNPSFEIVRLTETELEIRQNLDQEVSFEDNNIQTSGTLIIRFNR